MAECGNDKILLIDILQLIWKWKIVILLGTIIFCIISLVYFFYIRQGKPVQYNSNMLLKPAEIYIDSKGNKRDIDSPENMKALIDGEYQYKAIASLVGTQEGFDEDGVQIDTIVSNRMASVEVKCKTSDPRVGVLILERILQLLEEHYTQLKVDKQRDLFTIDNDEIEEKKRMLNERLFETTMCERQLALNSNRIDHLKKEIPILEEKLQELNGKNTDIHLFEKLLQDSKIQNPLLAAYLVNTIVQYRNTLISQVSRQIDEFRSRIYQEQLQKETYQYQVRINKYLITQLNKKIAQLVLKSDQLHDAVNKSRGISEKAKGPSVVNIVQMPVSRKISEKEKIGLFVTLSGITGFLLMVFLSFMVEYVKQYKKVTV